MAAPLITETAEDAEDFLEKVDEVHRLIEGLKEGKISPEYIDTKIDQKLQKKHDRLELQEKRPAGRGAPPTVPDASSSKAASNDDDQDEESERRERAMAKVKELMANRERKLRARARYEEYVKSQDKTRFGTDYNKWDIWCPEDEEDDLINSIAPSTPQFKAMEKDIDDRHRQMVERRQLAERCRVRGNEAYQARQYSEALRCYQEGIDSERTNMTLHANAAMAALKINCFVQAIEHCDKVLSIADWLHNNKKHPLCVKALQRRAEAYRALAQTGKSVQDLQAALELDPGNSEVDKQLAKANVEDEEARKQRAIAKAVGKAAATNAASNSGAAMQGQAAGPAAAGQGTVEAAGVVLDFDKLGRLERLAASLAPPAAEAAAASSGRGDAGHASGDAAPSSSSSSSSSQQPGAAQRGPALPPRRQGKDAAKAATGLGRDGGAEAAAEATVGGGGGDGSGGERAAAGQGGRGDAGHGGGSAAAAPAPTTGDVCGQLRALLRDDDACCVYFRECGGLQHVAARIAAKRVPGSGTPPDLAALLMLLNDACMNDGNLKQLPGLKVLPAVVAVLDADAAGEGAAAAAAAAVTLLCTAVTNEDVRKEVSKLLAAGDGLPRLVGLMSTAKPVVQGVALALLGNCMVDKPVKAAMAAEWRRDGSPAAGCFLDLLRSPNAVLAEKAAVLLGNMATDAALRSEILARQGGVMQQLAMLACAGAGASVGTEPHADPDLQRAAATALFNLTVDETGQRLVAEDSAGLTKLYQLATSAKADRTLVARAAGVVARAAKNPAGVATLLGLGAVGGMLGAVTAALDSLESAAGDGGAVDQREALMGLLDAAVRVLTLLTSPDDAALAAKLIDGGGVAVLLRAVRYTAPFGKAAGGGKAGSGAAGSSLGESVLANAALCLAGVARRKEYLGLLREADPVPVLVGVAYEGRGNTASKNAAIALARMAHEPAMLEKLRELHGIEIIYQYVKP